MTLGSAPKSYYKGFIPSDTFVSLGVTLDTNIPNTYLPNETIHISGKELLGKDDTIVFLQSPSGKDISLSQKNQDGGFEYFYPLEETGNYRLVVSSGLGFETNTFIDITVLDPTLFSGKKLFSFENPPALLDSLDTERIEFSDLKAIYLVHFPTNDLYTLSITQDNNSASYSGFGTIAIRSDAL